MAGTAFEVDGHTANVIASLRAAFGVKTNAEVVTSALSLARIIAENAKDDHTVLVIGKDDKALEINLTK